MRGRTLNSALYRHRLAVSATIQGIRRFNFSFGSNDQFIHKRSAELSIIQKSARRLRRFAAGLAQLAEVGVLIGLLA